MVPWEEMGQKEMKGEFRRGEQKTENRKSHLVGLSPGLRNEQGPHFQAETK